MALHEQGCLVRNQEDSLQGELLRHTLACWKRRGSRGAVALKQGAHGGAEAGLSQSAVRSQP